MVDPLYLHIHHCASEPCVFFGREAELALLDRALQSSELSVVALVGPGGQGKTAILQHWLGQLTTRKPKADGPVGIFFWSFYRGKESDLCLRALHAAVAGLDHAGDVSASYCVDQLLPLLRQHRWVVLLDGAEVVQHEAGPWFGRFLHPDLGRLLEELASGPQAGVTVLTTRFPLPDLERRPTCRIVNLATLTPEDSRSLLTSLGVRGTEAELDAAASAAGLHAKAVELLATWLVRFHGADARAHRILPESPALPDASPEETHVLRVLRAFQLTLESQTQDLLALATAFRDPPTEERLLQYLASEPVRNLLHTTWQRPYQPFAERGPAWLREQLDDLVHLRLLERVSQGSGHSRMAVLDAHPLVRRGFEHVLGKAGRRETAGARAGFLRGRPDRQRAATLEDTREDVELFHAYCDAGLWDEADRALAALEMPRYRFLAPAFERDLLLRFFPEGDRRCAPLWAGFGRWRSLAVCLEMLGRFEEALETYRTEDAPLRGDALIALGRLDPLLVEGRPPHPWEMLWHAYRSHALCVAGRVEDAMAVCRRIVPRDAYEWTHVFECLLRAGELSALDMNSFLGRPPREQGSRWDELARLRMLADHRRCTKQESPGDLAKLYADVLDGYDRGGLPWERALTRLSQARWLLGEGKIEEVDSVNQVTLEIAQRYAMPIHEADAWRIEGDLARGRGDRSRAEEADARERGIRDRIGYRGPERP